MNAIFIPAPRNQVELDQLADFVRDAIGLSSVLSPPPPLLVQTRTPIGDLALAARIDEAAQTTEGAQLLSKSAVLIQTSGSTGVRTRLVCLPREALLASAAATHSFLGGPGRWIVALPTEHIAGLQQVIRSVLAEQPPVFALSAKPFSPAAFAQTISLTRATTNPEVPLYTSLVSVQLQRILDADEQIIAQVSALDGILVGGGKIAESLLRRAVDRGLRVVTTYGMSETSGGCVYNQSPLSGVNVLVVDEDEPGGVGQILLSGTTLMLGYLDEEATWFVDEVGNKWLGTGDLGYLDAQGLLHIAGRSDDIINSGGTKIATSEVAAIIAELPEVEAAFCYGTADNVWGQVLVAAVEVNGRSGALDALSQKIRDHVRSRLGRASAPRIIVPIPELPKVGLGKVNRTKARSLSESLIGQGQAWQR